eukprot:s107_g47.t1
MLDEPDTTAKLNAADASVYRFAVGADVEIRVHLAMDNSAGRTFFNRVGVGRIRHISLKVLWVESKVKEGFRYQDVQTVGFHWGNSKPLMRILLINALSSAMAMDPSAAPSMATGLWKLSFAFLIFTMICLLIGFLVVAAHYGAELQQRLRHMNVDVNLRRVLELLREAGGRLNGVHETIVEETPVFDPTK